MHGYASGAVATSSAVRLRCASSSANVKSPAVVESALNETALPPFATSTDSFNHGLQQGVGEDAVETLVSDADRLPHLKPMLEMAEDLINGAFVADAQRLSKLHELIRSQGPEMEFGRWPIWVEQEYSAMRASLKANESPADRAYRRARSMLWTPVGMDAEKIRSLIQLHSEDLSPEMQTLWVRRDRQEQLDVVLKPYWDQLSETDKSKAILRARFDRVRSLGWRRGYTSGYPISNDRTTQATQQQRDARLNALRTGSESNVDEASSALLEEEDRDAWSAFKAMTEVERKHEERLAWKLRDRSLVFIDDTSSSTVAGIQTRRWYATPQRIGSLSFLPNDVIRLVRNTTTRGANKYDAFKATFRVPLHMHKHGLRSYLLAIYGLRTTWCRSMIYRAPIRRSRLGQKEVGSSKRTFKKVELGLLEPFVFPEMTESFAREHLYKEEMRASSVGYQMKLSGRKGWRTTRLPNPIEHDPLGAAIEESALTERLERSNAEKSESDELDQIKPRQTRLSTMSGGMPSKRQSRILKHLSNRRKMQEAIINAQAQNLKAQAGKREE